MLVKISLVFIILTNYICVFFTIVSHFCYFYISVSWPVGSSVSRLVCYTSSYLAPVMTTLVIHPKASTASATRVTEYSKKTTVEWNMAEAAIRPDIPA